MSTRPALPAPHQSFKRGSSSRSYTPQITSKQAPSTRLKSPTSVSQTGYDHPRRHESRMNPPTPTPKRTRRPKRAPNDSAQRGGLPVSDGALDPSSEDELMDLLGVASPSKHQEEATAGLLAITKEQIAGASGPGSASSPARRGGRERGRGKGKPSESEVSDVDQNKRQGGEGSTRTQSEHRLERQKEVSGPNGQNKDKKKAERNHNRTRSLAQNQGDAVTLDKQPTPTSSQPSGLAQTRPKKGTKAFQPSTSISSSMSESHTFDVSELSKSLPSVGGSLMASGLQGKGRKKNVEEGQVWEMPTGPAEAQELTWQQRLQAQPAPTRQRGKAQGQAALPTPSSNLTTSKPKSLQAFNLPSVPAQPSPLNPKASRPAHARRHSLDSNPGFDTSPRTSGQSKKSGNQPQPQLPPSAFDAHIPFHTGYNSYRAPQTPFKLSAAGAGTGAGKGADSGEWISSEAPKLRAGTATAVGGIKYAGPTFHNSPSGSSLAKPEMDDF